MTPDYVAYLTISGIGKSVANSALPNAPVIDDSCERPSLMRRLSAARMRLTAVFSPGMPGRVQPAPATGC